MGLARSASVLSKPSGFVHRHLSLACVNNSEPPNNQRSLSDARRCSRPQQGPTISLRSCAGRCRRVAKTRGRADGSQACFAIRIRASRLACLRRFRQGLSLDGVMPACAGDERRVRVECSARIECVRIGDHEWWRLRTVDSIRGLLRITASPAPRTGVERKRGLQSEAPGSLWPGAIARSVTLHSS